MKTCKGFRHFCSKIIYLKISLSGTDGNDNDNEVKGNLCWRKSSSLAIYKEENNKHFDIE